MSTGGKLNCSGKAKWSNNATHTRTRGKKTKRLGGVRKTGVGNVEEQFPVTRRESKKRTKKSWKVHEDDQYLRKYKAVLHKRNLKTKLWGELTWGGRKTEPKRERCQNANLKKDNRSSQKGETAAKGKRVTPTTRSSGQFHNPVGRSISKKRREKRGAEAGNFRGIRV